MRIGTKHNARSTSSPDAGRVTPKNNRSKIRFTPRMLGSMVGAISSFATGCAFAAPWVVTNTSDDAMDTGSLRHAVVNAAPGDTITFDLPTYPAAIQLTGSDENAILSIQKSLTIIGPGASQLTITAVHTDVSNSNAFNVSQPGTPATDINVAISGLRIEYGGSGVWCSGYAFGTDFKVNLTLADLELVNNIDGVDVDYTATATISDSTISGGDFGINAYSYAEAGGPSNVTIERSTLSNNHSAVYNGGSNVAISNSTLVDNGFASTDPYWASVIGDAGSTTTLVFSTVSGSPNVATPGLRAYDASAVFNLKNTLVAGHSGGNCAAQITSLHHNLSDDASCSLGANDLDNTTAGLDPAGLASNGGTTQTIALLPASPAMNAVPIADCSDAQSTPVLIDQRGFVRPVGSGCEIGAWELNDRIFSASFD